MPCCDICDPTLLDRTRPPSIICTAKKKIPRCGKPHTETQQILKHWRREVYARDHRQAHYDYIAILDNDFIKLLSSVGPVTPSLASQLLSTKWVWWPRYGAELAEFLGSLDIVFEPLPVTLGSKAAALETSIIHAVFGDGTSRKRAASFQSVHPGSEHPASVTSTSLNSISSNPSTLTETVEPSKRIRFSTLMAPSSLPTTPQRPFPFVHISHLMTPHLTQTSPYWTQYLPSFIPPSPIPHQHVQPGSTHPPFHPYSHFHNPVPHADFPSIPPNTIYPMQSPTPSTPQPSFAPSANAEVVSNDFYTRTLQFSHMFTKDYTPGPSTSRKQPRE